MRGIMGLALGLALLVTASAQAQSRRGHGFFGFDPNLFGSKPTGPDPSTFTIPTSTTNNKFTLMGLLPKINAPIGKPTYAVTTLPTYSPLGSMDYLKAFHYRPAQPLGR